MSKKSSRRGPKLKFPLTKDCKRGERAMLCPAERVIRLYNEATDSSAKKIAKKVREWFRKEAHEAGWAGIHFLPEVQTNHGAGCILWLPPEKMNITVTVTHSTLVLEPDEEVR